MNKYKYEYHADIKAQRAAARGAAHRKRGSRSKKCSLPSDNLTPKQLRDLNGEVTVYNLGQPMTQEEYDRLPDDLKPLAKVIPPDQSGGGHG